MDNDDLFEIIEPETSSEDNIDEILNSIPEFVDTANSDDKDNPAQYDNFVQDDSFVNSLDFVNGFSEAPEEEIEKMFSEQESTDAADAKTTGTDNGIADIKENEIYNDQNNTENVMNTVEGSINSDVSNEITDNDPKKSDTDSDTDMIDEELDDFDDEDFESAMVIPEGTIITGSITTACSLDIYGTINGDIFCDGELSITGKVTGNSHAKEVMINANRVEGNIECEGAVKISQGSVIIGDITAGAAVIAGAVKGTLDVKGPVVLDSTAVIKGNIKAKSVQLINGAVLEGFCSLEYANSNVDEIFN